MMHNIKYIPLVLFMVLTFSAQAQRDTISKEVVVVKEFNPTINDAFKINNMPGIPEKPKATQVFNYEVNTSAYQPPMTITPLKATPFQETSRYATYQNHVSGAFGNYSSFYADVFYNAYSSEEYQLDFMGSHLSTFGKIKLEDGTKSYAPFMKNNLGMVYTKLFKTAALKTDIQFNHRATRYYGYQTVNDTTAYRYQDVYDINGSEINTSDRQYFTDFNFDIHYKSLPSRRADFMHDTRLLIYTLGDQATNRENSFTLGSDLFYVMNESKLGGEVKFNYLVYNDPSDILPHRNSPKNNIFYTAIKPYYAIEGDAWNLKLGVSTFAVAEQGEQFKFLPTPNISFDVDLIEDLFQLYIKAQGDYRIHSYKALSLENPYIAPNMKAVATKIPLDIYGGLRATTNNGIDINVSGGYEVFKNQNFFVNEVYLNTVSGEYEYSNLFRNEFDDGGKLKLNAEVVYHSTDQLDWGATFSYQKFNLDSLEAAWHIPQVMISAYGKYDITEQISAKLLYQMRSATKAKMADGGVNSLKAVHDVSIMGEYKYNERLSGFVHINNLLAQKYYLWNGYPSQGINALIGATFYF